MSISPQDPMNQQLDLPLERDDTAVLPARLGFPVATDGGAPFDDVSRFFEPWWPGALAHLRRLGDSIELRTEHLTDPLSVFPELTSVRAGLAADGSIIEGTLLALDAEGRPDAHLLRRRLGDR